MPARTVRSRSFKEGPGAFPCAVGGAAGASGWSLALVIAKRPSRGGVSCVWCWCRDQGWGRRSGLYRGERRCKKSRPAGRRGRALRPGSMQCEHIRSYSFVAASFVVCDSKRELRSTIGRGRAANDLPPFDLTISTPVGFAPAKWTPIKSFVDGKECSAADGWMASRP